MLNVTLISKYTLNYRIRFTPRGGEVRAGLHMFTFSYQTQWSGKSVIAIAGGMSGWYREPRLLKPAKITHNESKYREWGISISSTSREWRKGGVLMIFRFWLGVNSSTPDDCGKLGKRFCLRGRWIAELSVKTTLWRQLEIWN